jgi:hypothetical protein
VGLADIETHLDRRALKVRRRAGDSKPARIAAAKAHFDAIAAAAAREAGVLPPEPPAPVNMNQPSV